MVTVSQQTLDLLAATLVATIDLELPVDRISLSEERGLYGDTVVDKKALAPNPDKGHQFEFCKILEEPDYVETYVKVAFGSTTSSVEWWNIKLFLYIAPYSAFLDKAISMPEQFLQQVMLSNPEFLEGLDERSSEQELLKKLIHGTQGLDPSDMNPILKNLEETGEFAATRQLAITSIFKKLLATLSDESVSALYDSLVDTFPSGWGVLPDAAAKRGAGTVSTVFLE